jgi:hypothetical protein
LDVTAVAEELRVLEEAERIAHARMTAEFQRVSVLVCEEHRQDYLDLLERTWAAAKALVACQQAETAFVEHLQAGGVKIGTGSWDRVYPHYTLADLSNFKDRIEKTVRGVKLAFNSANDKIALNDRYVTNL